MHKQTAVCEIREILAAFRKTDRRPRRAFFFGSQVHNHEPRNASPRKVAGPARPHFLPPGSAQARCLPSWANPRAGSLRHRRARTGPRDEVSPQRSSAGCTQPAPPRSTPLGPSGRKLLTAQPPRPPTAARRRGAPLPLTHSPALEAEGRSDPGRRGAVARESVGTGHRPPRGWVRSQRPAPPVPAALVSPPRSYQNGTGPRGGLWETHARGVEGMWGGGEEEAAAAAAAVGGSGGGEGGREGEEPEEEAAGARAAGGTREGRASAGSTGAAGRPGAGRGGALERARPGWRARRAAEGGGWWEPRATSPAPLRRVWAGVRAAPPESGEGGGWRKPRGRSGRWGGTRRPSLPPSLPPSRGAAAAALPPPLRRHFGFAWRRGRRSPSRLRDPPPLSFSSFSPTPFSSPLSRLRQSAPPPAAS